MLIIGSLFISETHDDAFLH